MVEALSNGIAALAIFFLLLLLGWKYSQIWAVAVGTKLIQIYFEQKRATSSPEVQVS